MYIVELDNVGCEALSEVIAQAVIASWLPKVDPKGRVWLGRVEVRETQSNMASVDLVEPQRHETQI